MGRYVVATHQMWIQNFHIKNTHQFLPCELREESLRCHQLCKLNCRWWSQTQRIPHIGSRGQYQTQLEIHRTTSYRPDIKVKDLCLDFWGLPSPVGSVCCLWEMEVSLVDHIQHKGWSVSHDTVGLYGGLFWKACVNTRNQKKNQNSSPLIQYY